MMDFYILVMPEGKYWSPDDEKFVDEAPEDQAIHRVNSLQGLRVALESQGKSTSGLPPEVPRTVTMAQARIALQMTGKLDAVQKGLESLAEPGRSAALQAWEYAPTVSRTGALVQTLSGTIGFTPDQLDELFIAAGNIKL